MVEHWQKPMSKPNWKDKKTVKRFGVSFLPVWPRSLCPENWVLILNIFPIFQAEIGMAIKSGLILYWNNLNPRAKNRLKTSSIFPFSLWSTYSGHEVIFWWLFPQIVTVPTLLSWDWAALCCLPCVRNKPRLSHHVSWTMFNLSKQALGAFRAPQSKY